MKEFLRSLLPQPPYLTWGNLVAGAILAVGLPLVGMRWILGLGSVTNLTDDYPWGFWIGFDVVTGVALAAGGYVMASAVHLFGLEEYKPVVRPALLTGFLGYILVIFGVAFDLGRPWHMPWVVITPGLTSILFLVGMHVGLYTTTQFVEISPAVFEWLRWRRWRDVAATLTVGATIFGVILSTLHQSALGALFLAAPTRLHPLWYSSFIPLYFFVSSIIAGLSMVILEGTLSHKVFSREVDISHERFDRIVLGLGKAASVTLAVYFCIRWLDVAYNSTWSYLGSRLGMWFIVELVVFFGLPCFLYAWGVREKNATIVKWTSALAVLGIVVNRLDVAVVAFNWQLPPERRYHPSWMEIWISLTIVTCGVLVFKWIVHRLPILHEHPATRSVH